MSELLSWLPVAIVALGLLWLALTAGARVYYGSRPNPRLPGGTTYAQDRRDARRFVVFVFLPWLARVLAWPVRAPYRHLTGRDRRRVAYRFEHARQCHELAAQWAADAVAFRDADYPLSWAATQNGAELMTALAIAFTPAPAPAATMVLPAPAARDRVAA